MLTFDESMNQPSVKDNDKCIDYHLWHACAGGMVQMPAMNSTVYFFPQGLAEHAHGVVDFGASLRMPPLILCRVTAVKFMADSESDEVFAKIQMVLIRRGEPEYEEDDRMGVVVNGINAQEKPTSFAKTLTQSDANNGGGFSVPRYCAETIFPALDYTADPPVQTVIAKDVHGDVWRFRHIYRGTPRRHLLTTGWSTFVNQKKLVAGDSIVFLKTENGDICIGIRRAKRGGFGGGAWNPPSGNGVSSYEGFSVFLREEQNKLLRGNVDNLGSRWSMRGRGQVRADSVIEAVTLASSGQPFEVVYYPRGSTPEFCVKAAAVKEAMRIQWCPGMRFKMAFETEDSSRISWFMGTITSVQVTDPIRWPNSPWRSLQVTWDEPDLLKNVNRVNPWQVELDSNMPTIHLANFTPPSKKPRIPQQPDFLFGSKFPTPEVPGNPRGPINSPLCFSNRAPAGIQGARHSQHCQSLSDLTPNNLQTGPFHPEFDQLDCSTPLSRKTVDSGVGNPMIHENVSCLLSIGHPSQSPKISGNGKPLQLFLFGQQILIEQHVSLCKSESTISDAAGNGLSDGNFKNETNVSGSAINQKGSVDTFPCYRDHQQLEHGLETMHCKVFIESEDIGHTLDLSVFGSYEELYGTLADMVGVERSEMMSHVLYKDAAGAVKHTGDEPFSDFMRTARRLIILTDSGSDNLARDQVSS